MQEVYCLGSLDEVKMMQEVYCLRVTGRGEGDARSVVFTGHWTR